MEQAHGAASLDPAVGLRARRRAQTERDLEDCALAAFAEHGFADVTMEQIASRAGVSASTAFRYFPAKVDTVLHSARRVFELLGTQLRAEIDRNASLTEIEDSIGTALASLGQSDPAVMARLKQLRKLMLTDTRLRGEVTKSEGYLVGLDASDPRLVTGASTPPDASAAEVDDADRTLRVRLRVEIAAATLRAAFDTWADSHDDDDRLGEFYARARALRRDALHQVATDATGGDQRIC
jgi:AcrR family transcriptional regulator